MAKESLIELNTLREILNKVIDVFKGYNLNNIEINFVVNELARLNRKFDNLIDKEIEEDLLGK